MFRAASKTLAANKESLNQADDYNHNHGDNMVEIFGTVTRAMNAKKTAAPAEQLEYASQILAQKGTSGSAVAYSEGLSRAANQFQGRQLNAENAVELISSLMGSGTGQQQTDRGAGGLLGSLLGGAGQSQESSPAGDLLGSLLGGGSASSGSGSAAGDLLGSLLGGGSPQQQTGGGSGDMLGSLLGGLMGGGATSSQSSSGGIDTGDLLNIGMQLFQAYQGSSGKPSGQSSSMGTALLDLLLSGSKMGSSSHRTQSGKLVADTLLKMAGKYFSKK